MTNWMPETDIFALEPRAADCLDDHNLYREKQHGNHISSRVHSNRWGHTGKRPLESCSDDERELEEFLGVCRTGSLTAARAFLLAQGCPNRHGGKRLSTLLQLLAAPSHFDHGCEAVVPALPLHVSCRLTQSVTPRGCLTALEALRSLVAGFTRGSPQEERRRVDEWRKCCGGGGGGGGGGSTMKVGNEGKDRRKVIADQGAGGGVGPNKSFAGAVVSAAGGGASFAASLLLSSSSGSVGGGGGIVLRLPLLRLAELLCACVEDQAASRERKRRLSLGEEKRAKRARIASEHVTAAAHAFPWASSPQHGEGEWNQNGRRSSAAGAGVFELEEGKANKTQFRYPRQSSHERQGWGWNHHNGQQGGSGSATRKSMKRRGTGEERGGDHADGEVEWREDVSRTRELEAYLQGTVATERVLRNEDDSGVGDGETGAERSAERRGNEEVRRLSPQSGVHSTHKCPAGTAAHATAEVLRGLLALACALVDGAVRCARHQEDVKAWHQLRALTPNLAPANPPPPVSPPAVDVALVLVVDDDRDGAVLLTQEVNAGAFSWTTATAPSLPSPLSLRPAYNLPSLSPPATASVSASMSASSWWCGVKNKLVHITHVLDTTGLSPPPPPPLPSPTLLEQTEAVGLRRELGQEPEEPSPRTRNTPDDAWAMAWAAAVAKQQQQQQQQQQRWQRQVTAAAAAAAAAAVATETEAVVTRGGGNDDAVGVDGGQEHHKDTTGEGINVIPPSASMKQATTTASAGPPASSSSSSSSSLTAPASPLFVLARECSSLSRVLNGVGAYSSGGQGGAPSSRKCVESVAALLRKAASLDSSSSSSSSSSGGRGGDSLLAAVCSRRSELSGGGGEARGCGLGLCDLGDALLLEVCLAFVTEDLGRSACEEFVACVILPKCVRLVKPASRLLVSAATHCASSRPDAATKHLLVPLLCRPAAEVNTSQCEVATRLIRAKSEGSGTRNAGGGSGGGNLPLLPPSSLEALLASLAQPSSPTSTTLSTTCEWTDLTISVLIAALNALPPVQQQQEQQQQQASSAQRGPAAGGGLSAATATLLVERLENVSHGELRSSLKVASLVHALVSKHPRSVVAPKGSRPNSDGTGAHGDGGGSCRVNADLRWRLEAMLRATVARLTSFMAKSAEAAINRAAKLAD